MNRQLQGRMKSLDQAAPIQRQASGTSISGLHSLHQTYGNRAVGRLLSSQAAGAAPRIQRTPNLAGMIQSVENKVDELNGKQLDKVMYDIQDDVQAIMFNNTRELSDAISESEASIRNVIRNNSN